MTEQQLEHETLYERALEMLVTQAGMMTSLKGSVTLDHTDVADLYIATGCNVLLTVRDAAAVIAYLRSAADQMERRERGATRPTAPDRVIDFGGTLRDGPRRSTGTGP